MPGKWLDPESHYCEMPESDFRNVGRRWQCVCGKTYIQVKYGLPGLEALFWEMCGSEPPHPKAEPGVIRGSSPMRGTPTKEM